MLGFPTEKIDKPVSELSVGWKMRIVLAKLLLQKADFYLLDEPTNHLDIRSREALEDASSIDEFDANGRQAGDYRKSAIHRLLQKPAQVHILTGTGLHHLPVFSQDTAEGDMPQIGRDPHESGCPGTFGVSLNNGRISIISAF